MAGLAALRLLRPGVSDTVVCLVDEDKAPQVIEAMEAIKGAARADFHLKLVAMNRRRVIHETKYKVGQ